MSLLQITSKPQMPLALNYNLHSWNLRWKNMKTLLNLNSTLNICVNCKVRYYINLKVLTIIYDRSYAKWFIYKSKKILHNIVRRHQD